MAATSAFRLRAKRFRLRQGYGVTAVRFSEAGRRDLP